MTSFESDLIPSICISMISIKKQTYVQTLTATNVKSTVKIKSFLDKNTFANDINCEDIIN